MDVDDHRAWVAVGRSRRLVRLDPATGRPRGSIGTPLAPVALVVTSRSLWVGLITAVPGGPDELAQYDRRSGELMRRIPVPEGIGALAAAPGGAIWIAHRRRALVSRFDTRTLSITRRVRVGADAPFGIAFGAGAVWVSSPRDDLVTRVDPDSGNVTRIGVGRSPQGIAVRGDDVFVANSDDNTVTRIDARTRLAVGSPLQVDLNPYALAVDHGSVWVTCVPDSRVVRIRYQPLTGRGG